MTLNPPAPLSGEAVMMPRLRAATAVMPRVRVLRSRGPQNAALL